jgi:hypothetical protein
MTKFNKTITKECADWVEAHGLIDYGGAMLKDFCKRFSIDYKTFYHWMEKPEFKKAVTEAKETFKKRLSHDLSVSLAEVAKGYSREETETEYVPNPKDASKPVIKKFKKKTVYYQPNVAAAIFLLTNIDPDNYQNKQRTDVAVKKLEKKEEMSKEEIDKEIERLDKLISQE